jgi:hypothetical protein
MTTHRAHTQVQRTRIDEIARDAVRVAGPRPEAM